MNDRTTSTNNPLTTPGRLAFSGLLAVAAAIGFFLVLPEYGHADRVMDQVDRLERTGISVSEARRRIECLALELDHRAHSERVEIRLSTERTSVSLRDVVTSGFEDDCPTELSLASPVPVPRAAISAGAGEELVVGMNGRFSTLIAALERIESTDRLIRVRSLRVHRAPGEPGLVDACFKVASRPAPEDV
ncbi:MAG: hypothetical protein VYD99_05425 [Planctomycetota bacterium]|nr:hypothetical protein [Planctomycetota bacterium]